MATHLSFEADREAGFRRVPSGQPTGWPTSLRTLDTKSALQWKQVNRPVPEGADTIETTDRMHRSLYRKITREQGCALEMIGHAVDYLYDCYLQDGAEDEIVDFSGPTMEAAQLLISTQRQILRSLPLAEPLTVRLRNALFHRKSQLHSSAVVPLSSSR